LKLNDPEVPIFAKVVSRLLGRQVLKRSQTSAHIEAKGEMKVRLDKELALLESFKEKAAKVIDSELDKVLSALPEVKAQLISLIDCHVDDVRREINTTLEYFDHSTEAEFQAADWPLLKLLKTANDKNSSASLFRYYCGAPGLDVGKYILQEFRVKTAKESIKRLCGHQAQTVVLNCDDTWCQTCLAELISEGTEGKIVTHQGETGYKKLRCTDCNSKITKDDIKSAFGIETYKAKKAQAAERLTLASASMACNSASSSSSSVDSEEARAEIPSDVPAVNQCALCRVTKPRESFFLTDCECNWVTCKKCTAEEFKRDSEVKCSACWRVLPEAFKEVMLSLEDTKEETAVCSVCSLHKPSTQCIGLRCCRSTFCKPCLHSVEDWTECYVCSEAINARDLRDIQRIMSLPQETPVVPSDSPQAFTLAESSFCGASDTQVPVEAESQAPSAEVEG
jgi:hypothetical protein